jgi:hypothetical protein
MDRARLAINRGGDSGHIAPAKQFEMFRTCGPVNVLVEIRRAGTVA